MLTQKNRVWEGKKKKIEYEKKKKSGWWDMDLKPRYQLMYYDENDVFKS